MKKFGQYLIERNLLDKISLFKIASHLAEHIITNMDTELNHQTLSYSLIEVIDIIKDINNTSELINKLEHNSFIDQLNVTFNFNTYVDSDGIFDYKTSTITIEYNDSIADQFDTLTHELVHWFQYALHSENEHPHIAFSKASGIKGIINVISVEKINAVTYQISLDQALPKHILTYFKYVNEPVTGFFPITIYNALSSSSNKLPIKIVKILTKDSFICESSIGIDLSTNKYLFLMDSKVIQSQTARYLSNAFEKEAFLSGMFLLIKKWIVMGYTTSDEIIKLLDTFRPSNRSEIFVKKLYTSLSNKNDMRKFIIAVLNT
jgi:hypothetical protein